MIANIKRLPLTLVPTLHADFRDSDLHILYYSDLVVVYMGFFDMRPKYPYTITKVIPEIFKRRDLRNKLLESMYNDLQIAILQSEMR